MTHHDVETQPNDVVVADDTAPRWHQLLEENNSWREETHGLGLELGDRDVRGRYQPADEMDSMVDKHARILALAQLVLEGAGYRVFGRVDPDLEIHVEEAR
jgi:hypothetical protein